MALGKKEAVVSCKGIFIGTEKVGKTALLQRLDTGRFADNSVLKMGIEFKNISVVNQSDNKEIKIQFWNVFSNDRLNTISETFISQTSLLVMLCVDLTRMQESLHYLEERWRNIADKFVSNPACAIILLGMKDDLADKQAEIVAEAKTQMQVFAKAKNIKDVCYVSAKTGAGLDEFKTRCAQRNSDIMAVLQTKNKADHIGLDRVKTFSLDRYRGELITALLFFTLTMLILTIPFFGQLIGLTGAIGLVSAHAVLGGIGGLNAGIGVIFGEVLFSVIAAGLAAVLGFGLAYGVKAMFAESKVENQSKQLETSTTRLSLSCLGSSQDASADHTLLDSCGSLWHRVMACTPCSHESAPSYSPMTGRNI